MIKFKNPRVGEVEDISEFNDVVADIIDEFLEPLMGDERYCIPLKTDADYEYYNVDPDEGSIFVWKDNIGKIVDRAIERFGKIAEYYFPDDVECFEVSLRNLIYD